MGNDSTIGLDVTLSLTVNSPGVAEKFLSWYEQNKSEEATYPFTGLDSPLRDTVDAYWVSDLWHVAILKSNPTPEQSKNDYLYIHIYPNIPLWEFADKFWDFLTAIGVDAMWYQLRCPDYVRAAQRAIESIIDRSSNLQKVGEAGE